MAEIDAKKLLALLGLANRAGKLAVGFSAVEQMVRRGKKPLVVTAAGMGPSQRNKVEHWTPVAGFLDGVVTGEELAQALGREKLVVVGVSDIGFVKGIVKLKS